MCSANEKLFAKTVPVSITDAFSSNFRSLFLSIEWQQSSAVILKKELLITLTDNNDPFFLYNLQLSEEDFLRLKDSQNLKMDFSAFPQTVIKFLELCVNEASKPHQNLRLHLIMGETVGNIASMAQLNIEQWSEFRQLALISLKFLAATESSVKQHMTACFKNLKEENQRLQNQLCYLENDFKNKFSACESALEKKSQELDIVKQELQTEISRKEREHAHLLMEEREKLLNKLREGENRLESEMIDKETRLKNEITQLETRVFCLEKLNKELENKKEVLEKQLNELQSHNLSAESDLRKKSEALALAERNNSDIMTELAEKNGRINHLMGNINQQKEELKHKQGKILNLQKELDVLKKEKKNRAISFQAIEEELNEEKERKKEAEKEAFKANQIIDKLQCSARNDYKKFQMLMKETSKLKENLREKEQYIQSLEAQFEGQKEINIKLGIETQQVPEYLRRITVLETDNRTLRMVIDQYTQILNNHGIIPQYIPPKNFEEKFPPTSEAINMEASGDSELRKKKYSTSATGGARPKSASRLSNPLVENGFQPETRKSLPGNGSNSPTCIANNLPPEMRQVGASMLGNSVNSPSQAFNTKTSTIIASDRNANQSNLEINSNGLSSEFKGLNISKHSTARKQTTLKSSRLPVRS